MKKISWGLVKTKQKKQYKFKQELKLAESELIWANLKVYDVKFDV